MAPTVKHFISCGHCQSPIEVSMGGLMGGLQSQSIAIPNEAVAVQCKGKGHDYVFCNYHCLYEYLQIMRAEFEYANRG